MASETIDLCFSDEESNNDDDDEVVLLPYASSWNSNKDGNQGKRKLSSVRKDTFGIFKRDKENNNPSYKVSKKRKVDKKTDDSTVPPVEKKNAVSECCVCLDADSSHAMIPCGHKCVCKACGELILAKSKPQCPICTSDVSLSIQIFG